jgi:hypothetical protein
MKSGKSSAAVRVSTAILETGNDVIIGVNLVSYMRMLKSLKGRDFARLGDAVDPGA